MDVTEIQKRRDELRIRAAALIEKFEVETGMQVEAINAEKAEVERENAILRRLLTEGRR